MTEGTMRALVSATGGRVLSTRVTGPLGASTEAAWGLLGGYDGAGPVAVIERAAAAAKEKGGGAAGTRNASPAPATDIKFCAIDDPGCEACQ